MFRRCCRTWRHNLFFLCRSFSSLQLKNQVEPPNGPKNSQAMRVPSVRHQPNPPWLQSRYFSRNSLFALSATIVSVAVATSVLVTTNTDNNHNGEEKRSEPINSNPIYSQMEHTIEKSNASIRRILNQMKQTGMAASVLWESLRSVMSSANHEVRVGFESRVAALLADIAAASSSRRAAIVGAGGGKVVDWLLQTVAARGNNVGTQTEAARALAYLIADPNVCEVVLGRQSAVPNLLSFIFSCQPRDSKKHSRRTSFDVSDSLKGRSMLITALMDVVTSNCNNLENPSFQPSLPANAVMRDIAAAIQVIEEGGLHLNVTNENDDDDSGKGIKGIGIKVLGGTTVLGLSQTSGLANVEHFDANHLELLQLPMHWNHAGSSLAQASVSSTVVPGLWDDLHCQHVAVPFATWALANWAMASDVNRFHIHELDHNGHAVLTALAAPERSVKWHASLVAQSLLDDRNLPLKDSVSDWSSSLLSTIHQASKTEDISLAQITLSAFLLSVERSHAAQQVIMEKGLHLMRGTAKQTENHKNMQDSLAKTLELLCTRDTRLSLEESQRWSGVLFPWVFGDVATEATRSSATKILSCILEDYGPSAVPMSQGWLTFLLTEILSASRIKKGSTQPKSDKVKTNIDQSYILTATQVANQLAGAVVNLAGYQLGATTASFDTFPLAALLSLEPFAGPFRNLKKENLPKVDAADSAAATLKGIKALTEVCMDDSMCQNKIVDHGVLCLLRRLLICDDYEKLAAVEAYDASRDHEATGKNLNVSGDSHTSDPSCSSSVRVPPTAHIRRHATRLLTMLSLLPKVQKVVAADETLCEWLEECANGKIPGCGDLKIQSYARATLLNIFCSNEKENSSSNDAVSGLGTLDSNRLCPRFADMIFLVNPEMSHWKFPENTNLDSISRKCHELKKQDSDNGLLLSGTNNVDSERKQVIEDSGDCSSKYESSSLSEDPLLDVVFIHGLRGGPYKTWRIADDKSSTTRTGLVEKIDEEAGKQGTFWPSEWLAADFPQARLFTIKYKTNLTQWSGASLPLQEVSSMLLETLVAAGIGDRPVVFVTHSMGGLVVKQLLHKAKEENIERLVNNTIGVVFYSCPHFGSKLADMPWRMGLVFRPAPTIGELRSGSPRLVELNDFLRHLHKKGMLEVLSFCETKVTPIVEGYGGWAFRLEIVPIESAYPGFGELVVLESTDHINSCKPVNRADPSYTEILNFLNKLKARLS